MSTAPVGSLSVRPTKLPVPYCDLIGQRILVYQDEFCERYSKSIIVPKAQGKEKQPTIGTVVSVGDGFVPHEWLNYADQPGVSSTVDTVELKRRVIATWREVCPVKVGDRVMWSKYEDIIVTLRVHPDWWSAEDLKQMQNAELENGVDFTLLDISQVAILNTSPELELWQES